ncbi:MAG TPA: HD domain-containing protein [Rhabdochlamydiaceae bacterium]|nr:HD domain-containing protein [Rhabdochlamydiaceae bacterium]
MALIKKIYDSVHGFIRFNELESALIDSIPFQRLQYIHQLGIAFLVYPGATHTRFEHSLGVMELASQIFDRIISKYEPKEAPPDYKYWRQVLRFAALCHDLGHLPFSHLAEQALLGEGGHEKWSLEIIKSPFLSPIWSTFKETFPEKDVMGDIIKLSIGENKLKELGHPPFSNWEQVICQIISGDFFGADRIDYLIRDAKCTGVSYGSFDYHQLIEMLCILPALDGSGRLELGIEENGIEACEALLIARHFMHRRVYKYPSVKAYAFHLIRFMKLLYSGSRMLQNLEDYLSMTDSEVLCALNQAVRDPSHEGHQDAVCLMKRHHRFNAFEVPDTFTEADLQKLQTQLNIPDDKTGLELSKNKSSQYAFSFPALSRHGSLFDARHCSKLEIPPSSKNWAYIDPEHSSAFQEVLECSKKN